MKKLLFFLIAMSFLMSSSIYAQKVKQWVSTDREKAWQMKSGITTRSVDAYKSITINRQQTGQTIKGFGACFNELGWVSLSELSEKEREAIFQELFSENGMNLTINRMPVGANDFSTDYYSYDDVDGDFEMENFSIAHDENTLIPFIKSALAVNPEMYLWASPWCPPAWMKINKHYACSTNWSWTKGGADNKLPADLACVVEGMDVFTQVPRYLSAYAKYFGLFIDAYKQKGIKLAWSCRKTNPIQPDQLHTVSWSRNGEKRGGCISGYHRTRRPQLDRGNPQSRESREVYQGLWFPVGWEGCTAHYTQESSTIAHVPDRAGMWRWQERLEGCHAFMGFDEALFQQWCHRIRLLEHLPV